MIINQNTAEKVLAKALSTGGDFAEIFCEDTLSSTINMIDNKIETAIKGKLYGAGVRIFKGLKSVYSTTNDLSEKGLLSCAEKAAIAIDSLNIDISINLTEKKVTNIHDYIIGTRVIDTTEKVDMIKESYNTITNYSKEIVQASVSLAERDQTICIANSEGLFTSDKRVYTRLATYSVASDGQENQTGVENPGRFMNFEYFKNNIDHKAHALSSAKQAVTMLHAEKCPAGRMMVAIENGFGGVIFHEACGHSLEATSVAKGASEFAGKLGEKIANEKVTAIDDGTIPSYWGSTNIDDEGTPTQKNILIQNGILKSYLVDKFNGRRMNMPSTGSGRRESYQYAPTSRMTNTYIDNGPDKNEDIIKSMENGLYAKKMGGGSVNPSTGEFNFSVAEGYIVKNGEICQPVRGASIIGKGSEILQNIDMVGQNMDQAQGMCGSSSGSVPTNVGQPLIRVSEITVGGM